MAEPVRIAMVAGEASGDLLGAHLMQALRRYLPEIEFFGIGGPRMMAAGFQALFPAEKLAVHGYIDALKNLQELTGIRRALARAVAKAQPAAFIGIDAPDFNIGLELKLRQRGIRTIHYVSPSIWAWRGGRIDKIRRAAGHVLVLFPFEEAIYREAGIPVAYVGHPMADGIPLESPVAAAREKLDIHEGDPVIALLPGSRVSEVSFLSEPFIGAAKLLLQRFPRARFLAPMATREARLIFEKALEEQAAEDLPVTLLFGHAQEAMAAADAVLVASGTATLEAALIKRPMVIAYKVAPVQYPMLKRMAYLPYIGLPNVLAGEFIVPEFVQDEATPENLAQALGNLVKEDFIRARLAQRFHRMHLRLRQNTAERAALAVLEVIGRTPQWQKPAVSA